MHFFILHPAHPVIRRTNKTLHLHGLMGEKPAYATCEKANAAVSADKFTGWGFAGIGLVNGGFPTVSGSTITANKGFATFNGDFEDIHIGKDVMDTIIDPGQAALFHNLGKDIVILPQALGDDDADH